MTLGGALTYSTNSSPLPANITGNLNLGAATRTFTINDNFNTAVDLGIAGPISGPAGIGIVKNGNGTLRFSGAGNTTTGVTTMRAGALELNKSSGDAIGVGGLSISTTSVTTVRLLAANQINDAAPVAVTNTAGGAFLDLAGFSETLGATTITANTQSGALITTGAAGRLTLTGDLAFANNVSDPSAFLRRRFALITGTGTFVGTADGTLDLGGAMRNVSVTMTVTGVNAANANAGIETAIVNGGINKTGPQTLFLLNPANTFPGGLNIAKGIVDIAQIGASGTEPITFNNTAPSSLRISISGGTYSNPVVVSAGGLAGATVVYSGAVYSIVTMTGNITLERNLVVDVVNGFIDQSAGARFGLLTLSGNIDDGAATSSMTKRGNGVLQLTGAVTHGANDMGFFGGGTTVLSGTGGGGAGNMIVGSYASNFADPGTGTPDIDEGHVVSVRGAFALPAGNIWLLNRGVLELGSGDFTRAVGNGAGQVRMETNIGAGFAAYDADRVVMVNLGGTGATLIFGDPVTKFLRDAVPNAGFDGNGALILGSATAMHTVTLQNPLEFNNGDSSNSRTIQVPNGPAAKEAVISGNLSLNGLPGTTNIFLGFFIDGAIDVTGNLSGIIVLDKSGPGLLTLTGANTQDGHIFINDGTLNATTDTALGDPDNTVFISGGAIFQAGGPIVSARHFEIFSTGLDPIIDTNGFDVTLTAASSLIGDSLEKIGAGTLTIAGAQDYTTLTTLTTLTASAGTTSLNSALGTGASIVNANATTNFGVSQTLAELNIGAGTTVSLTFVAAASALAPVPEPGSFALAILGALGVFAQSRRQWSRGFSSKISRPRSAD